MLVGGTDKQGDTNIDTIGTGIAIIRTGPTTGSGAWIGIPTGAFVFTHPDFLTVDESNLTNDMVLKLIGRFFN